MIQNLIFDLDSSFLTREAMEFLIEIGMEKFQAAEHQFRLDSLQSLAARTEAGEVSRGHKMNEQLQIAKINTHDLELAGQRILALLHPKVKATLECLLAKHKRVIIFSRAFSELVFPITDFLKIPRRYVFTNQLLHDHPGGILNVSDQNPLFLLNGKVYLAESMKNQGWFMGTTAVVGNSRADLSLRKSGIADYFVYVEGVSDDVTIRIDADFVITQFEQILSLACAQLDFNHRVIQSAVPAAADLPRPRTVLLENIHPTAQMTFKNAHHEVQTYKFAASQGQLTELAMDSHVLGIRSKTQLPGAVLAQLKSLLTVGCFCIGTDQVDLEKAAHVGIPVFNAPYANTRSVAELVLGEVIMLMRGVFDKSLAAHQGQWLKQAHDARELRGKTMGIIGYGHIGSQVAVLSESLGMQVIFFDIMDKLSLGNSHRMPNLETLLRNADVVTLHVPDTPLTRGMLGVEEFAQMKSQAILINTSRGRVVDLAALKNALETGNIGGAGIDVFPYEPASGDETFVCELQKMPNVILTPHIGGSTLEAQAQIALEVSTKLTRYLETGATIGAANFPELELPPTPNSCRIGHIFRNMPGSLAKVHNVFLQRNIKVLAQIMKTKDEIGYLLVDIADDSNAGHVSDLLNRITETIKVRIIRQQTQVA